MSELIDRQAALKKLAVYIHLIDKTMGKGLLTDDDCMEAAKSVLGEDEVPAVQPEIIRCKDCKHRYLDGMIWNCPFGLSGGEDFFCAYGAIGGGSGT